MAPKSDLKTYFHSIVIGRLDYCNSLLYKVPAVHMSKLQRIQNSAARLVCSTPRFNHITPVIFSLHWLPVAYRIELKIFVLTFKAVYPLAPPYICNSSINKRNVNTSFVLLKNYYCSWPSNEMSTAPESQKRNDKSGGRKLVKSILWKVRTQLKGTSSGSASQKRHTYFVGSANFVFFLKLQCCYKSIKSHTSLYYLSLTKACCSSFYPDWTWQVPILIIWNLVLHQ